MFRLLAVGISLLNVASWSAESKWEKKATELIEQHSREIRPLEVTGGQAWWEANTTGSEAAYKKKEEAENRIDEKLSDPKFFKAVKNVRSKLPKTADPVLKRQIEMLYLSTLEKQVPTDLLKQIVARANAVEEAFNKYRPVIDGKEVTDSEIRKILKNSLDSKQRQAAWEASKGVGPVIANNLAAVVDLRNQAATKLGFKNFQALQLSLNEQDPDAILSLFDELDTLTRKPFEILKAGIDEKLAARYQIEPSALQAWHYHDPFFQESPNVYESNLDEPYRKQDLVKLTHDFYAGIGLPVDEVIAKSDLYEKKGKSPHAFCTDIDRDGDVRVLANVVPTEYWMNTMLHEFGHAVYSSRYIPSTVPYLLRDSSHILTTEGIAMIFQKLGRKASWLKAMGVEVKNPEQFESTGRQMQRSELLIFSRWVQVMFRFEKAMYENPKQDLNALWWSLVEKYQGIKKPSGRNQPDYASKIHIATAPVYYHNYLMGELFAAQVHHTLAKTILKEDPKAFSYAGNKAVGDFYRTKLIEVGAKMSWNELTKHITGEPLNAKAFAEDIK